MGVEEGCYIRMFISCVCGSSFFWWRWEDERCVVVVVVFFWYVGEEVGDVDGIWDFDGCGCG